jgi:2-polyprenyl-6-methoxyphenol hydroxylase-like FAD-dependent oxidoreductase
MISPNCTRVLLDMHGMRERLDKVGAPLKRVRFHDKTGNQLTEKLYPDAEREYGFPTWMIHRGDLHDCLLAQAQELNMEIRMGQLIEEFDGYECDAERWHCAEGRCDFVRRWQDTLQFEAALLS